MNIKTTIKTLAAVATIGAVALTPFGAWAGAQIIGELKWSYNVEGSEATITGVERTTVGDRVEGTVTVPNMLGTFPVTVIGFRAFADQEFIKEVVLPVGITTIDGYSFIGCKRLTTLALPSTVRTIGVWAFNDCSTLEHLTLNEGLTEIESCAFGGCAALKELKLPSTVQILGESLFRELPLLEMEIPDSVTEIGVSLFDGCDKLERVVVGKRVPKLTFRMFAGCESLTSVTLKEGYLDSLDGYCFIGCKRLTTLALPSTVRTIDAWAFEDCTALRSVVINKGLTELCSSAFENCKALHYVYFQGDKPAVGENIFRNVNDRMVVYISESSSGFGETLEGHPVKRISEKSADADNPYDFYLVTPEVELGYDHVAWPAPVMLTSKRYEEGETAPTLETVFREGDPIYLSYAFDEYWRGAPFDVTNRFTLSGAKKKAIFGYYKVAGAHSTVDYFGKTNAVPESLQNLAPGEYTLTFQLNGDQHLKETDYSNNTTSITFTVVGSSRYTVSFDLNGVSGTAPAARSLPGGASIGELPTVTASAGWTFLGWFTAANGGDEIKNDFTVTADITCFAHWSKCDLGFETPTGNGWTDSFFLTTNESGGTHMSTVQQGETLYLQYNFKNLAGPYDMSGFINRFTLSTGATFDEDYTHRTVKGGSSGWADNWVASALQDLAPGTYTLTCMLDATGVLAEANEDNNTQSITFTVVPKGAPPSVEFTVTFNANGGSVSPMSRTVADGAAVGALPAATRDGYTLKGWFTAASGGTQVTAATVVTANVTYYAQWTKNSDPGPVPPDPEPCYEVIDAGDIVEPYVAPKAVTLLGAVYDGCDVVGLVELKLGKVNAKKGTSKVSGNVTTLDGKKHSIKSVNITGIDGTAPVAVSLSVKDLGVMDVIIGGGLFAGSLGGYHVQSADIGGAWGERGATVAIEVGDVSVFDGMVLTDFLPDEEQATVKKGKWTFAKAASVKWAKPKKGAEHSEFYDEQSGKDLIVDDTKGKTNLSGLKLTYTAKTGVFKGSFKVYALQGSGKSMKLKTYTINVNGFVVDGVGYGKATCKKPAISWSVTVR